MHITETAVFHINTGAVKNHNPIGFGIIFRSTGIPDFLPHVILG